MNWWHWWQTQASTIGTTIAVGTVLGKFFVVNPLRKFIKEQTKPIQPDANGGKSLPDVAIKLAAIQATINGIEQRLIIVDKRLDRHIEQHVGGET